MDHCDKCGKDTDSRPNFLKRKMVCVVCGTAKGPLEQQPTRLQQISAIVRPPCAAIIKVSTDEWVMMEKTSKAWLYTADLVGCVAVVVQSSDRVALAHVLDRNSPQTKDKAAAIHALNLITAVLGHEDIQSVDMIINSIDRSEVPQTPTLNLVREWVRLSGIDKSCVDVFPGDNCVMVCPEQGDRATQPGRKVETEEKRLLKNPATGVTWITNWGKLPQWQGHAA